jgi:hypothetical protein
VVAEVTMTGEGPGSFRAFLCPASPGSCLLEGRALAGRCRIGADRLAVGVSSLRRGWRWPKPDAALLAAGARATGGPLVADDELEDLPKAWPTRQRLRRVVRRLEVARGLGPGPLVLGLLVADGLLRRKWGLI